MIFLNEKRTTYRLDSDTVSSPTQDTFLLAEVRNDNLRNLISYSLDYIIDKRKDCGKLDRNTSMLTVYGIDDLDNMHTIQYFPCTFQPDQATDVDMDGFKTLYFQFYRETKNPSSGLSADKFVLSLDLKLVQTKYIVLTDPERTVSSDDFDNLYLRNYHLDFEIRAPVGDRIILNVSRFDNGKKPSTTPTCDDYLMVRLNKTTNRMKSFYETSHNPTFCSSLGPHPVIFSSYTNTLMVSIFFKKLGPNDDEIGFPTFEFSYTTEPFCDNVYTVRQNSLISFSSLQSMEKPGSECHNTITVGRDRRIILYKIDWLDYNIHNEDQDEVDVNFMNGRTLCNGSDSLIISEQNPKYAAQKNVDSDPNDLYNTYCMANPFR